MKQADRIALFALAALIVPGLGAIAFAWWHATFRSADPGHDTLLIMYGMYAAGVILWSGLRMLVSRAMAAACAGFTLMVGLPFGAAAASLGILTLLLPLMGLGGIVASMAFPRPNGSEA